MAQPTNMSGAFPGMTVLAALVGAVVLLGCTPQGESASRTLSYPDTRTVAQHDRYFGVEVLDPYRWLEADVRESAEVADWVARQNAVTFAYLDQLEQRQRIKQRVTELWAYDKYTVPIKRGGQYFSRTLRGLQNQAPLYVRPHLAATPRTLLDPNSWSDDGTVALAAFAPSPDGKYVAYTVQNDGSDWREIRVVDVATGQDLDDELHWSKFGGAPTWRPDNSGFYYSRYPAPASGAVYQARARDHAIYFHRLGTKQEADQKVYARADRDDLIYATDVIDDRLLVAYASPGGTLNEVALAELGDDPQFDTLIPGFTGQHALIHAVGDNLLAYTDAGAPNGRIVSIDRTHPAAAAWTDVVPEQADKLLSAEVIGGVLVAHYLNDVKSVVRRFELDGRELAPAPLPGIGSASGFIGQANDAETFFAFSSYNLPATLYRYDAANNEVSLYQRPQTPFDPEQYVVKQHFYASKDGTRIPMFIAHRRDANLTTPLPTVLYGYGGFNVSLRPTFSLRFFSWLDMGGVLAVANVRGGGEYGRAWHQAGQRLNKQNVFDDFIAAAEYLIHQGVTSPDQLGITGGSNGGLLVGAVINQRPELFAAAIPAVGVMDMLRFDQFTAGPFWRQDYGSPSEDEADFRNLLALSPYHNIRDGADYPAVLVATADTDDRVVPGHSFKYAAALQAANTGTAPKLLRVQTKAGHGSGKPTTISIEEYADSWSFIAEHTGLQLHEDY